MAHGEALVPVVVSRRIHKLRTGVLWILQVAAATAMLSAGFTKLTGAEEMVRIFEAIGFGQWFRILTGSLEVGGAVLLVVPALAWIGALVLSAIMLGAVFTHLFLIGGSPASALVLLIVTTIIVVGRFPSTLRRSARREVGGAGLANDRGRP